MASMTEFLHGLIVLGGAAVYMALFAFVLMKAADATGHSADNRDMSVEGGGTR